MNFAADQACKRCQSPRAFAPPGGGQTFFEHSAPGGDMASGLLKAIGIGSLILGMALSFLAVAGSTPQTQPFILFFVLLFVGQGVMIFALFYGFGVLIENTVAIRKNTQHLAGIRANTQQQHQQPAQWQ